LSQHSMDFSSSFGTNNLVVAKSEVLVCANCVKNTNPAQTRKIP
jgi:hypothetical protein